jgi:hypothetical protein
VCQIGAERLKKKQSSRKGKIYAATFAFLVSLSLALTFYLLVIQTPLVSKRELLAAFLVFAALPWFVYLLIDRYLAPHFLEFSFRGKLILIILSLIFGLLTVITTNRPPLYLISPSHTFKIEVPAVVNGNTPNREVTITWITTSLGDVSFAQLRKSGEWVVTETGISHFGLDAASLEWQGKTGGRMTIDILKTAYDNPLSITWDQKRMLFNLADIQGNTLTISQNFNANEGHHPIITFSIWVSSTFFFFVVTILLLTLKIQSNSRYKTKRFSWLLYILPMIVVWSIFLLTFFPGMMSDDSNVQWSQILTGQFNDIHPVFHTLSMWLVTRIWLSPAAVVLSQILFLSLTVAWGIRLLEEHGLPPWGSWLLAVIFAIAPLNGNMVVVVWKDIPYSTSLFLFSLMVLKIVLTNGAWLEKRLTWMWIGLVSLCVTSFRHNGLPIPFATILVLLIFYRKWWKPLLQTLALTTILYAVIHGPIYNAIKIGHRPLGFVQEVMLHHISAHINTGKPLTPSEQELADFILPKDQWRYNCCTALPIIMHSPNYHGLDTEVHGPAIRELFIDLAVKEPLVELTHLKCVSSIVWRSPGFCGANTLLPYDSAVWIDHGSNYNTENSLIPLFQKPLAEFLIKLRTYPSLTILISPGVYLWLSIYAIGIFAIRIRNWKALFFNVPVVIQAATYVLINISDNFRYHYGAYLMGLFGFGLLILAMCQNEPSNSTEIK